MSRRNEHYDTQSNQRLSRFLAFILRHRPNHVGIELDEHGWADVEALIAGAEARGVRLTRHALERVVRTNDKRRFAFDPTGTMIRANQGHSIDVDLGLISVPPPPVLYHGTVGRFVASIKRKGLQRRRRHHVHLSPDRETAIQVGRRRGEPIVLAIDAASMAREGHRFFQSANNVWLTSDVPSRFIAWPAVPQPDGHGACVEK